MLSSSSGIFWTLYLDVLEQGCECSNPGFFTYREVLDVTTGGRQQEQLTLTVATTAAVTSGRQVSSITSGKLELTTGYIADVASPSQNEESTPQSRSVTTIIIAVLVSVTFIILALVLILYVVIKKMKKLQIVELDSISSPSDRGNLDPVSAIFSGNAKVVKYQDIAKGKMLGKGSFGVVHK